jgi:RimJ/RimL family protein N-acetyltransferase
VGVILQALLLDIPEVLESPRLTLRATRAGMGAAVNAAVLESFGLLKPWMPWSAEPQTLDASEEHCRDMQAKWHAREMLDFCFVRREDGQLVGKGGLHTIDWTLPKFEIGYWVRTCAMGHGYATEATMALTEFARATLGACRIEITSDAQNGPSRRVAEKAGYTLEGIRRKARRNTAGELSDACMYAKVF